MARVVLGGRRQQLKIIVHVETEQDTKRGTKRCRGKSIAMAVAGLSKRLNLMSRPVLTTPVSR